MMSFCHTAHAIASGRRNIVPEGLSLETVKKVKEEIIFGRFSLIVRKERWERYPTSVRVHIRLNGESATALYVHSVQEGLTVALITRWC